MIIIGIDPGQKGALTGLGKHGLIIEQETMRDVGWLVDFFKMCHKKYGSVFVYLEKAQSIPGNAARSMFSYGVHNGEIMGILGTLGIPYELVPPQAWTKVMHAGVQAGTSKKKSLIAAKRLFPHESFLDIKKPKSSKPHDGLIDATLIAEFGRRKWLKT